MSEKKIPTKMESYDEGTVAPSVTECDNGSLTFEPKEGEKVVVTRWVRYPSYEFIFGVPDASNPKYNSDVEGRGEFGFFAFRRKDKVTEHVFYWSVYLDQCEMEEMLDGFLAMIKISTFQRPTEWSEYFTNKKVNIETKDEA